MSSDSTAGSSSSAGARAPFFIVDAFTAARFSGNPAAVVLLDARGAAALGARHATVAAEFNLSETAFVSPRAGSGVGEGDAAEYDLRWFTPTTEVNLCGHATLATAAALWTALPPGAPGAPPLSARALVFHTASGPLRVERGGRGEGGGGAPGGDDVELKMRFPAHVPERVARGSPLHAAIWAGLVPAVLGMGGGAPSRAPTADVDGAGAPGHALDGAELFYAPGTRKLFILLAGGFGGGGGGAADVPAASDDAATAAAADAAEARLRSLRPDGAALLAVDQSAWPARVTGVCVAAAARGRVASRYFSPWNGIAEDPVNGSSHTSLGPLFARARGVARAAAAGGGRVRVPCASASRRGGELAVELELEDAPAVGGGGGGGEGAGAGGGEGREAGGGAPPPEPAAARGGTLWLCGRAVVVAAGELRL